MSDYDSDDSDDPDYEYGDESDDDRPVRATPLRRANFASDAAFATAKAARRKANEAARYQLHKDAVKAKSKAAYALKMPAERKARATTTYIRQHAGATPVHRVQPAAARRHGIDVAPPATLVIHADNIMGANRVRVVGEGPALAENPNEPTNYVNMLGVIGRKYATIEQAKTRNA